MNTVAIHPRAALTCAAVCRPCPPICQQAPWLPPSTGPNRKQSEHLPTRAHSLQRLVLSGTWHCRRCIHFGGVELWPAHLVYITTKAAFYVARDQWIYLTCTNLQLGLEVHLQSPQPLSKSSPLLYNERKIFKKCPFFSFTFFLCSL